MLYRLLVNLYPRSYRERFGEEILQTTADMLDATPVAEHQTLWLRILIDTSMNIGYQHVMNGVETMDTSKKIIVSLAWVAVAVIAVAAFPSLRTVGMDWTNTAGFIRVMYLGLYCALLIPGALVMAVLSLFSRPKNLYKAL